MTVRFILGRSGSGKTHYCLEAIKGELVRCAKGFPLILLVPEQATFQMEQALVRDDRLDGYNRALVMSFERLAHQILWETGPGSLPVLSEFGKQMILRRLLQERQSQLKIFNRAANRSGFITQLSAMLRQLRQYRQTPEQLAGQCKNLLQADEARLVPLAEKLSDLAVIYQAYQDHLAERFVDPDDFLDLVSSRCQEAEVLRNGHLWVDGFAGFTPQQYHALAALTRCVVRSEITICLDPLCRQFQIAQGHPDEPELLDQTNLFHPTLQTYQRLARLLGGQGQLEPALILPSDFDVPLPRFRNSTKLARLEHNFLNPAGNKTDRSTHSAASAERDIPVRDIVILEASQRRQEVRAAAGHILRLCREQNYRFSDIAVILRDFGDYQELLEATFTDYDIPYFIDRGRRVHHHPLIKLLRCCLQIIISDFQSEHVIDYLKTDLAPLPREAADSLEDYVGRHGIQSDRWYTGQSWRIGDGDKNEQQATSVQLTGEQLNQYRLRAIAPLLQMREELYGRHYQSDRQLSVRDITAQLAGLLEKIDVGEKLSQWRQQAQDNNDHDQGQTHEQIYKDVIGLMDDMVESLGDCSVTLGEYSEILCSAMEQMTLRLIPPGLDQVLIGTIERSRHPRIRAAFVLGVNEQYFPRVSSPDTFFTDPQRELLARQGLELAPTSTEKLMHERYLAYIALTRPQDFLWVSFPIADENASTLNPSSLIANIQDSLGGGVPFVRLSDDSGQPDPDNITTLSELSRQLALSFSPFQPGEKPSSVWTQLYHYARKQGDWLKTINHGLAGSVYHNNAELNRDVIKRLFPQVLRSSVSRLETFAACPFQHFARYILQLEKRRELKLGAMDMGSFYHDALCRIFLQMSQARLDWRDLTDEKLDNIIETVVTSLIKTESQFSELKEQSHRNRFLLDNTTGHLQQFCRSLRAGAGAGNFYQRHAELEFGPESAPYGPLEIDLPDGRRLALRGKIDRVDVCLRDDGTVGVSVIDYKSSARSFPYGQFYHGLSLQLISYLLVLQTHYRPGDGEQPEPAAALFLPIHRPGQSHPEPPGENVLDWAKSLRSDDSRPHKATGLIGGAWIADLDHTVKSKEWSQFYSFYINKDNSVYIPSNSAVVTPKQMSALIEHCRKTLARLATEITDGKIEVSPYRLGKKDTPCSRCDYHSLCRFDFNSESYNELPSMSKQDVLDQIEV